MNAGKTTTAKRCIDQSGTLSETNVSGIATLDEGVDPVGGSDAAPGDDAEHDQGERRPRDRAARAAARRRSTPPSGPAGERRRSHTTLCASRNASGCPIQTARSSGIEREEQRRDGDAGERASPVGRPPGEHDERRQQGDAGGAGQQGEPGRRARPAGTARARRRGTPRPPGAGRAIRCRPPRRRATSARRRGTARCVARPPRRAGRASAGRAARTRPHRRRARPGRRRGRRGPRSVQPSAGDEERIEREERGRARGPGVAVLGDPEEPVAVPPRPDVDRGAEVVEAGAVPFAASGVERSRRTRRRRRRRAARSRRGSRGTAGARARRCACRPAQRTLTGRRRPEG